MPFILNREYNFFIPEKKSTVLQILFNCLKCYNVTQVSVQFFGRSGKKKWHWVSGVIFGSVLRIFSLVFQFKLSIQVIYFSVVSDVNLRLLTSCKKLDSVFQVCLLRNFFSLNIHIVYTLFFFF